LREREAAANRARIERDRLEADLAEEAGKTAEDLIATKDWTGLQAHLKDSRDVMSLEQYSHYSRALNGSATRPSSGRSLPVWARSRSKVEKSRSSMRSTPPISRMISPASSAIAS
jgi:hypothetical protein